MAVRGIQAPVFRRNKMFRDQINLGNFASPEISLMAIHIKDMEVPAKKERTKGKETCLTLTITPTSVVQ